MDKALTVIIPAYNMSQYIDQEMDSLLKETSILPYLDIIIVNDGSKDDTLDKANRYAHKYPESIRVIDKENGGHGSGINVGIVEAKGKYLKVLDGDDWVDPEGLVELINYIMNETDSPDAIINPFEKVWENGKREVISFEAIEPRKVVGFKEVVTNKYTLPLHTLTIKTQIYRDNKIPKIDEKISYDDMEYILYPVPYIKKIVFLEKVLYEYRLGLPGQSMNPEQMKKKLLMHTKVIESLAEYYRTKEKLFDNVQAEYYKQEFVDTLGTNYEIQIKSGKQYRDIKRLIKQYSDFPLKQTKKKTFYLSNRIGMIGYCIACVKLRG